MVALGFTIMTLGTAGLIASIVLEVIKKEPVFMLLMKISMGVMAVGGTLLGTHALMGG